MHPVSDIRVAEFILGRSGGLLLIKALIMLGCKESYAKSVTISPARQALVFLSR